MGLSNHSTGVNSPNFSRTLLFHGKQNNSIQLQIDKNGDKFTKSTQYFRKTSAQEVDLNKTGWIVTPEIMKRNQQSETFHHFQRKKPRKMGENNRLNGKKLNKTMNLFMDNHDKICN